MVDCPFCFLQPLGGLGGNVMFQTSKKEFRSAGGILQGAHPAPLAHVMELVEVVRDDFAAQDLGIF